MKTFLNSELKNIVVGQTDQESDTADVQWP